MFYIFEQRFNPKLFVKKISEDSSRLKVHEFVQFVANMLYF